jgi:hypothetical protein
LVFELGSSVCSLGSGPDGARASLATVRLILALKSGFRAWEWTRDWRVGGTRLADYTYDV